MKQAGKVQLPDDLAQLMKGRRSGFRPISVRIDTKQREHFDVLWETMGCPHRGDLLRAVFARGIASAAEAIGLDLY